MRTTIDTFTGKPFRWNAPVRMAMEGGHVLAVPGRFTDLRRKCPELVTHLAATKCITALLRELNPTLDLEQILAAVEYVEPLDKS